MNIAFDGTITLGNIFASAVFVLSIVGTTAVAIMKRDAKMGALSDKLDMIEDRRAEDMRVIDKRFETVGVAMEKQADILSRIAVYDVRIDAVERAVERLSSDGMAKLIDNLIDRERQPVVKGR